MIDPESDGTSDHPAAAEAIGRYQSSAHRRRLRKHCQTAYDLRMVAACLLRLPASRQRCRDHSTLADRGQDPAGDFSEADAGVVRAGRGGADRDLVAVLEEDAAAAVGELGRVLAVPGVFDQ